MVHIYTLNMKGVDQSVQQLSYNSFNPKTVKWWKRVAIHIILVAKVQDNSHQKPLTKLDFTVFLVKELTAAP